MEFVSLYVNSETVNVRHVLRLWFAFLAEDPFSEPPRNLFFELEASMTASSHTEDIVEFFKCPLLSLGEEEKD